MKRVVINEFDNEPFEYTVYPLEGVWTTSDGSKGEELNKEALVYKIMVRQPEVVTKEMFEEALAKAKTKKPNKYFDKLKFEKYTEGKAVQTIHIGPFDEEPKTFAKLDEFLQENNLKRINTMGEFIHREIYLSDFRRVAPEKRKTVLRYRVTEV
ncbi:MAG: GyrI-like domain-containing protein [Micrococcaceae bacterium]